MSPLAALRAAADGRDDLLRREIAARREVVGLLVPLMPPAELVEASGAIPFRLLSTGGADADLRGLSALGRDSCGFCRAVLGEAIVAPPPVTCVAAGAACDRMRRAMEAFAHAGMPVFFVAVPRVRGLRGEVEALAAEFGLLARELAIRTGVEATPEALAVAIRRGNRARAVLRSLDALRAADPPRMTGTEFFDAVRASHVIPSGEFLALAEELPAALAARAPTASAPVRVLLAGPTLADGRREVLEMLEADGSAVVVADATDSGSLGIGDDVREDGDPLLALAEASLAHPVLAAPLRPAGALRARFAESVASSGADGVVFRGLPFCRPWNSEVPAFRERCPVPFLDVRVDGTSGLGQVRTRIEAFVETLVARRRAGGAR